MMVVQKSAQTSHRIVLQNDIAIRCTLHVTLFLPAVEKL